MSIIALPGRRFKENQPSYPERIQFFLLSFAFPPEVYNTAQGRPGTFFYNRKILMLYQNIIRRRYLMMLLTR